MYSVYFSKCVNNVPITCRPIVSSNRTTKQVSKKVLCIEISPKGSLHLSSAQAGASATSFTAKCVSSRSFYIFLASKYLPIRGYILWSDLATAHYARVTNNLLFEAEVRMVTSEMNPSPKASQLRPSEAF